MPRYISVNVYAAVDRVDCSNNGITRTHSDRLVVEHPRGNITEEDVAERGYIVLVPEMVGVRGGSLCFCPPNAPSDAIVMFGGNFVWSSDSRFTEISSTPVRVHDRFETYRG